MCIRDRVDNVALLSLQEKQDGVEFHCFDMDSKVQIAEGHIGWDVLDKQPFSTLEESARVAALKEIPQLDGLTVAPVAPEMLEQMRGGRKVLWQMKKAEDVYKRQGGIHETGKAEAHSLRDRPDEQLQTLGCPGKIA